jgi:hypothetical protein
VYNGYTNKNGDKIMKKRVLPAILIAMTLAFSACGADASAETTADTTLTSADTTQTVAETTLKTAAAATEAPATEAATTEAPMSENTDGSTESEAESTADDEEINMDLWETVNATFVRDDSSEYSNGILTLQYIADDKVYFEFELMEGSEGEDSSTELTIYGEMTITEEDRAVYDITDSEGERQIIFLGLNETEDGWAADVATTGEFEIYPDGHYIFAFIEETE